MQLKPRAVTNNLTIKKGPRKGNRRPVRGTDGPVSGTGPLLIERKPLFSGPKAHPKYRNTKKTRRVHTNFFEKFARTFACFPVTWVRNPVRIVQKKTCSDDFFILGGFFRVDSRKFRGKFRGIFRKKIRSSNKNIFRAKFTLQTCHLKKALLIAPVLLTVSIVMARADP